PHAVEEEGVQAEEEQEPLPDAALVDLPEAGDQEAEQGGQRVEFDRREFGGVGGLGVRLGRSHRWGSTRKEDERARHVGLVADRRARLAIPGLYEFGPPRVANPGAPRPRRAFRRARGVASAERSSRWSARPSPRCTGAAPG